MINIGFIRKFLHLGALQTGALPLLFILINLVLIIGITNRHGEVLLLSIPLILLYGLSLVFPPTTVKIQAEWDQEIYRIHKGESISIRCTLRNCGLAVKEIKTGLLLPKGLRKVKGTSAIIAPLGEGQSIELEMVLSGECGTYELKDIELVVPGFLGINAQTTHLTCKTQIIILPLTSSLKGLALRPHRVRKQAGINLSRQGGEGLEVFGIREYQPGDPLRYVSASASARHPRSLFIQEFEQERVANVLLLLDTHGQSKSNAINTVDLNHSLEAAALLGLSLLDAGNRLGLFVFGNFHNWVFPGSGKLQKERIVRALAFKTNSRSTWDTKLTGLPTRFLTPRSFIIVISPLLGTDLHMLFTLKGHRHQVVVISPDEIGIKIKHSENIPADSLALRAAGIERKMQINRLSESGIPVLNWPLDLPIESMLEFFLARYWQ